MNHATLNFNLIYIGASGSAGNGILAERGGRSDDLGRCSSGGFGTIGVRITVCVIRGERTGFRSGTIVGLKSAGFSI